MLFRILYHNVLIWKKHNRCQATIFNWDVINFDKSIFFFISVMRWRCSSFIKGWAIWDSKIYQNLFFVLKFSDVNVLILYEFIYYLDYVRNIIFCLKKKDESIICSVFFRQQYTSVDISVLTRELCEKFFLLIQKVYNVD